MVINRHHHHHRWRWRRIRNPGRVAQIRKQIEEATSDYDREKLQNVSLNWLAAWQ
ncbi:hypothetical protein J4734_04575 [Klebsiella pneumoniae]|uniref:Uncharacterized protein n=1 Tax=Klebsiella pneumoniae TaxID=573 RepID=A0A939NRR6_KLEPN|nr:hypothetical protein [Klebsiella pneumoniae]